MGGDGQEWGGGGVIVSCGSPPMGPHPVILWSEVNMYMTPLIRETKFQHAILKQWQGSYVPENKNLTSIC